jgi:hypothetical protein
VILLPDQYVVAALQHYCIVGLPVALTLPLLFQYLSLRDVIVPTDFTSLRFGVDVLYP